MHFLGAVIAEKQDDIYGILAEWSEYADVDEYINEDGDAVSTFNEDSFYDYYEIGEWEGVDALQGITCRELADRYNREDALARTAIGSLCVICKEGWYDGGLWNDTTTATVLNELERNTGRKVWWLNFHD